MRRQSGFHKGLDLFDQSIALHIPTAQHNKRLHDLSAQRVWNSNSGSQCHGGMAHQAIFYFTRTDTIA